MAAAAVHNDAAELQDQSLLSSVEEGDLGAAGQPKARVGGPWLRLAGASFAAAALLSMAALIAVGGGAGRQREAHVSGSNIQLWANSYADPQGKTVCGTDHCDCQWAQVPGKCQEVRDDGTACYHCCCQGQMGGQWNNFGSNGGQWNNFGTNGQASVAPLNGHYHVGDHVYVKGADGHNWLAVITEIFPNGSYHVSYLETGQGNLDHHDNVANFGANVWWCILIVALVVLAVVAFLASRKTN